KIKGKKETKEQLLQTGGSDYTLSTPSIPSFPSIPSTHEAPLHAPQSRQPHAVTYRELNKKANTLAYILQSKGVKSGTIVALMVERSIEMIIALLGILKAGGAYLPIALEYPDERINYMLKDSNAKVLLKEFGEFNELKELKGFGEESAIVDINIINQLSSSAEIQSPVSDNRQPASALAYIIYTSGSTGRPKGVLIEHRNV
ncbi:MAG: AMP-binding protein, partial [bacterium]|nr:AMP-binding protein [bacterium]